VHDGGLCLLSFTTKQKEYNFGQVGLEYDVSVGSCS